MANIRRPKAERDALQRIHEPPKINDTIVGCVSYRDARDESWSRHKHRNGIRASVTVPELPWHKDKKKVR